MKRAFEPQTRAVARATALAFVVDDESYARLHLAIVECLPGGVVVVLRDRVLDLQALDRGLRLLRGLLKGELRRVDADYDQSLLLVPLVLFLDVGKMVEAIDAGICPEVDQHDTPAQRIHLQRLGIQPGADALELGRRRQAW